MPSFSTGVFEPMFHTSPLWLFGVLLVIACMAAREVGAFLYRYRARRRPVETHERSDIDTIINGAIFSLLALVVGFTFSIALDRYDARRAMVTEEANAISTAYLGAELFDEPARSRLQSALRAYAHTRVVPDGVWDEGMRAQSEQSLALRARIWDETRAAVYPVRTTDQASNFLQSINDTLSVGMRRELSIRSHIPTRIMDVLFLYMLIASGVLGYLAKGDHSRRPATAALLLLFSIIIVLILDLDRPRTGGIVVSQRPLEQLAARLDRDGSR